MAENEGEGAKERKGRHQNFILYLSTKVVPASICQIWHMVNIIYCYDFDVRFRTMFIR